MIIAGALNYKVGASRSTSVTEEVMNAIKKKSIPKSTKDAFKFGVILSTERYDAFAN